MNGEIILTASNISKSFPGVRALDKVRLEVMKGHVHALCGENGAGKSTLLKIITGLYTKDEGEIYIEGKKLEINSVADARAHGIHVVPQEIQMVRELSVAENIFLGRYPMTKGGLVDWKKMYSMANEIKEKLGGHAGKLNVKMKASELGMGSWQLIEIMRALIDDNIKVLAFDEPTSSLSDEEAENLFRMIQTLKEQGVAIIYVSHRLPEIYRICDEISIFKDGAYVGTRETANTTTEELINMMIGRDLNLFGEKKERGAVKDEVVLKVENFTHGRYYQDISLELKKGEILGLYGLVGAGRTEFARGLFGVDKKDSGDVWIKGEKVKIKIPRNAVSKGMGFLTENRREEGLMLELPLTQNISASNLKQLINKLGLLNLKKEREYASEAMGLFTIKASGIKALARDLSGGNQQKVVLTRWVKSDCDILIVDEPTRGIDVGAKHEVYEALKRLAREGSSIILISSELPEVLGISDRIIVFCEGKITAEIDNVELTEEDVVKYAFSS